jgi:site-specific recombinase XerD
MNLYITELVIYKYWTWSGHQSFNERIALTMTQEMEMGKAYRIEKYRKYLTEQEKSEATIEKYVHEIKELLDYMGNRLLSRDLLIEYRELLDGKYLPQTVNGKLNAVNSYLKFVNKSKLCLHLKRIQRKVFINENREMSEKDFHCLLDAAVKEKKQRLYYLMLTLAGTGIRVSELSYITVESVGRGQASITMKGKSRIVLITGVLQKKLKRYAEEMRIKTGSIFITEGGRVLDRSNICHELKRLCRAAGIDPHKVFPHNFRHLFARTFYRVEKNIAHLADILGHSSIETTRIYLRSTVKDYNHTISRMNLVR